MILPFDLEHPAIKPNISDRDLFLKSVLTEEKMKVIITALAALDFFDGGMSRSGE
jgi:hypothetical protein